MNETTEQLVEFSSPEDVQIGFRPALARPQIQQHARVDRFASAGGDAVVLDPQGPPGLSAPLPLGSWS